MKLKLLMLLLLCFLNHVNAQTSDYDKGLIAFDAKDFKLALQQLKPYAEKGDCLAQFAVGFSYMYGDDIKKDSLARHWLLLSAEQKQPKAMGPLAVCFFGANGEKDALVNAYLWGTLAAEYDPVQRITTTTTLVKAYMKPEELDRANQLIKQYEERWKHTDNCR